jgi:hypothetical protein
MGWDGVRRDWIGWDGMAGVPFITPKYGRRETSRTESEHRKALKRHQRRVQLIRVHGHVANDLGPTTPPAHVLTHLQGLAEERWSGKFSRAAKQLETALGAMQTLYLPDQKKHCDMRRKSDQPACKGSPPGPRRTHRHASREHRVIPPRIHHA